MGYNSSFFDTRRGVEFADTIIRFLPQLAEKKEKIDDLTQQVTTLTAQVEELTSLVRQIAERDSDSVK